MAFVDSVHARDGGEVLFSWYIVGYLFLAGAGSGAFFIGAVSCTRDALQKTKSSERLLQSAQASFYVTPCLMLLASVLLALDLGNAQRVWLVALTPFQSTLSMGAWCVALLTVVSAALAVSGLRPDGVPRAMLWVGCLIGVVLAIGTMTYTGLLLSDMVSIDFWHTPWLVALFVASSLSCGMAVVVGSDALTAPPSRKTPQSFWSAGVVLGCAEAVVLVVFMLAQFWFTDTARASCELLLEGPLAPAFWGGLCLIGLIVPLAAHGVSHARLQRVAVLISSASVLVGGFFLRYCIVAAALYTPLVFSAI